MTREERNLAKVRNHAAAYGMRFQGQGTVQFTSPYVSGPWTKGDGVAAHSDWLKWNLPPAVYDKIASMQPYPDRAKRCKRKIEIGFYAGGPNQKNTTVVISRRGFRCSATIALICLMAP